MSGVATAQSGRDGTMVAFPSRAGTGGSTPPTSVAVSIARATSSLGSGASLAATVAIAATIAITTTISIAISSTVAVAAAVAVIPGMGSRAIQTDATIGDLQAERQDRRDKCDGTGARHQGNQGHLVRFGGHCPILS
jgi:hypothetical protein